MPGPDPSQPLMLSRNRRPCRLSASETHRAVALSERLRQELTALLSATPRSGASALSLSRDLKIDRNVCHRLCSALEAPTPLQVISRLPGPDSLKTLIAAAGRRAKSAERRDAADDACAQFRRLIIELAGTHARLNARIQATETVPPESAQALSAELDENDPQVRMFQAARSLVGAWLDTMSSIIIVAPGTKPGSLDAVMMRTYLGLRCTAGTVPIAVYVGTDVPVRTHGPKIPPGVVEAFCTQPLPHIRIRDDGPRPLYVIEPDDAPAGGIDLCLTNSIHMADPRASEDENPTLSLEIRARTPALVMVRDVFIHKSLRIAAPPTASAVHLQTAMDRAERQAWHQRLPGALPVIPLGRGLQGAAWAEWDRHADAVAYAMSSGGKNPDDFDGYRFVARYPYWGACYYLDVRLHPD